MNLLRPGFRRSLFIIVVLAVVPSLGLAIYNAVNQRNSERETARLDSLRTARHILATQKQLTQTSRQLLTILSNMPAVHARMPDVRVLLVGGGPQEVALRALAQELGLGDRVVFAGRVAHAEVHRYYSIVDAFAYPRHSMRLTELVTPLKPLEAMAQGRLLVASDVGGHKELIRDGVTGVLFRAGDATSLANAIVGLLEQRDRWPYLRAQGRHFVEQERNWGKSVAGYRQVFAAIGLAEP